MSIARYLNRLVERPPRLFRLLYRHAIFRVATTRREVFLTFDDGPVPGATPWVLDCLDRYGVKATFFMVGDNAKRFPELVREVRRRGHAVGNHTMHHIQGKDYNTAAYMEDLQEADALLHTPLFRPPHGWLRLRQSWAIRRKYRMVMYDLVTRDYARHTTASDVVETVRRYAREGSVIVFHDSRKSIEKLKEALPQAIEWLLEQGYSFSLPDERFFRDTRFYPSIGDLLPGLNREQMTPAFIKLRDNGR